MYILRLPEKLRSASDLVVSQWLKKPGESAEKGEILCIIQDATQSIEMESPISGEVLKVIAAPGAIVKANEPLGIIGQKGEGVSRAVSKLESAKTANQQIPVAAADEQSEYTEISGDEPAQSEPIDEVPRKKPAKSAGAGGKVIPILMPQAGQSMEEGTIVEWKVKPGDRIETGQVILEIETDKAIMEVEAVDSGRLARIVAQEDTIVEVKVPVAYLAENDADVDAYLAAQSTIQSSAKTTAEQQSPESEPPEVSKSQGPSQSRVQAVTQTGRVKTSPAARKVAKEKGIDLGCVSTGSGPGGRILSTDVLKAKPAGSQKLKRSLSKMRRAIARTMQYSKQNIPHFYIKATVNAQSLYEVYQQTKQQFKCSVNDFVTMACAKAVAKHPAFRGQYCDDEIVESPSVNIGIAVGTDEGLTVPVLLDADKMTLKSLAHRSRELIENARNGKLEGIGQGIFTITNLGMFGVEEFSAIINPPESAILAVGAIREDIQVTNGVVEPTRLMTICLSVDHRVIDGVMAAQFIGSLKKILENPEQLAE